MKMTYKQRKSIPKNFTIADYMLAFVRFYKENNRYPTHADCDSSSYIPNGRTIIKNYKSILNLKKLLNEKYPDLKIPETRNYKPTYKETYFKRKKLNEDVYNKLLTIFPEEKITLNPLIGSINNLKAEYGIYNTPDTKILVELILTANDASLKNAINQKVKKYTHPIQLNPETDRVAVVICNNDLNEEQVRIFFSNRKNTIPPFIKFYTLNGFISNLIENK